MVLRVSGETAYLNVVCGSRPRVRETEQFFHVISEPTYVVGKVVHIFSIHVNKHVNPGTLF